MVEQYQQLERHARMYRFLMKKCTLNWNDAKEDEHVCAYIFATKKLLQNWRDFAAGKNLLQKWREFSMENATRMINNNKHDQGVNSFGLLEEPDEHSFESGF